jgi:hypothetical protein
MSAVSGLPSGAAAGGPRIGRQQALIAAIGSAGRCSAGGWAGRQPWLRDRAGGDDLTPRATSSSQLVANPCQVGA